jgi:hypothetical protein
VVVDADEVAVSAGAEVYLELASLVRLIDIIYGWDIIRTVSNLRIKRL